jgi:hypothetical protein
VHDREIQTDESRPDDCTTTGSFTEHGIEDGVDLITGTYYRLQGADRNEFAPTRPFFDRLESAFIWAYLGSIDERGIPPHVERAIDDAQSLTSVSSGLSLVTIPKCTNRGVIHVSLHVGRELVPCSAGLQRKQAEWLGA